ncbi:MAG: site-specific DNA-methyltransferase [Clostridia bacterium]|nr:site-specific DNA-methyltransferase [Clostridia bacterium]
MTDYIKQGDCLELMKEIPSGSVDMILCDLPYGVTNNKWDKQVDLKALWLEYKRVIKDNGAIVLFAKEPFTSKLIVNNIRSFKHKWIWDKSASGSFNLAKVMPLQITEDIVVFSGGGEKVNYYPQMRKGKLRKKGGNNTENKAWNVRMKADYENYNDLYYPTNVLHFKGIHKNRLHPCQKPTELLEYLIKNYTNEGETVLDNCMGCGSTIVACINTNRHYIGFELEKEYFDIAKERIDKVKAEL